VIVATAPANAMLSPLGMYSLGWSLLNLPQITSIALGRTYKANSARLPLRSPDMPFSKNIANPESKAESFMVCWVLLRQRPRNVSVVKPAKKADDRAVWRRCCIRNLIGSTRTDLKRNSNGNSMCTIMYILSHIISVAVNDIPRNSLPEMLASKLLGMYKRNSYDTFYRGVPHGKYWACQSMQDWHSRYYVHCVCASTLG